MDPLVSATHSLSCPLKIDMCLIKNFFKNNPMQSRVVKNYLKKCLEPISKSSEEDREAGELHEAKEVLRIKLPADKNAALPLNPGEEPFD